LFWTSGTIEPKKFGEYVDIAGSIHASWK
jgi:hypothetical protein